MLAQRTKARSALNNRRLTRRESETSNPAVKKQNQKLDRRCARMTTPYL
jgi:hypothetical protein